MSQRCMPILLLNMGAEMVYILEQRLKTLQNVGSEKSNKVLQDITYTMLNRKFLDELFKPQDLHSRKTMRHFFEKLAHSSIMRLNETSMDKLYDLITMTVKYQIQVSATPEQLLTITINHLDGMRELMPDDRDLIPLLDNAHAMLMSAYRNSQIWEFSLMRCCLLTFFQDTKVKVSILLREGKQLESGHFVLYPHDANVDIPKESEYPGIVRYYEDGALMKTSKFPAPDNYNFLPDKENFNLGEAKERTTRLGFNMYRGASHPIDLKGGGTMSGKNGASANDTTTDSGDLTLLLALMGKKKETGEKEAPAAFDMSFFTDAADEQQFIVESELNVKRINASEGRKTLKDAMKEMEVKDQEKEKPKKKKTRGQDLAEMMDEVGARPETAKRGGRAGSTGRGGAASRDKTPSRPTTGSRPGSRSTTPSRATTPSRGGREGSATRGGSNAPARSASTKRRAPSGKRD
ncbi:unnamed protein product, partial [Mesorhabditis belari]|uniref:Protein OSCP1 n=1 Tax=Mesorhabditis belari TaxID=2138241 RepID=A0AAF3J1H9_9BILA